MTKKIYYFIFFGVFLANTAAFAQSIPDGRYTGSWVTSSGGTFATCTYGVQKNSIVTEQCGSSAESRITTTKKGATFSYVPNREGSTNLTWTGSGFNGVFVRNDGAPGPKGTFSR